MSNSSSTKSLQQNKPSLFSPSVVRSLVERPAGSVAYTLSDLSDMKDTALSDSDAFKYDLDTDGLKSTQQLNIDWSDFANHTFYNSAQVKVNVAFDRILNEFPFDGSNRDVEVFFDSLTGFEKYVYDLMPKNTGYLFFSGTLPNESQQGTYVTVKDVAGAAYENISLRTDGQKIINPLDKPISIEYWIYVPQESNYNQVLFEKIAGTNGVQVRHYANISTNTLDAEFIVAQNTVSSSTIVPIPKGVWTHVAWVWNRDYSNNKTYAYLNGTLAATSSMETEFGIVDIPGDCLIGSGSSFAGFVPQTTFSGSMDELRLWHESRAQEDINEFLNKTVYPSETLKFYYKFNEPAGVSSAVVVDASSNSLHGKLNQYALSLSVREAPYNTQFGPPPVKYENTYRSPILFPKHPDVVALTDDLLDKASSFDLKNPSVITKLVPRHYLLDGQAEAGLLTEQGEITEALRTGVDPRSARLGATQTFLLLLYTWAKFFDEMKLYSQAFSDVNFTDYNANNTVPSQFLQRLGKSVGLELPPLFTGATVGQFIDGENLGDHPSANHTALKEIQNQVWRRILNNYKDIVRSKGTIHSIKAFIRAIGIEPDSNFRIREYGGPTKRNLAYVRDKRSKRATQLSFLNGGHMQSPFLVVPRFEPGLPSPPPLALPTAEFDEDYIFVNNSISATITFNTPFSAAPIFYAKTDDGTNVFGTSAPTTTGMTVQFSAPFTGFLHYRAVRSSAYPAYASSSYSPLLVVTANTYNILIGDNSTTHNITYPATLNTPSNIESFAIDTVGNDLSNIFLSTNSPTITNTTLELSAPAPNTRVDYLVYVDNQFALSPAFTPGDLTSILLGSWTYEGLYRFTDDSLEKQSLARFHSTGSVGEGLILNCVADETAQKIILSLRPNDSIPSGQGLLNLSLDNVDIFDGHLWHVSFGRVHPQDEIMSYTTTSSSFFLRAARQDNGEVVEKYEATSYFHDNTPTIYGNALLVTSSLVNASGAYIEIGSASIDTSVPYFLNDPASATDGDRYTHFDGRISNIKLWSRAVRRDEWLEHVRNYKSSGVNTPLVNYNFNITSTGSFERLRIDAAAQQDIVETDVVGSIQIFDYSQNEFHFSGSNFPTSSMVLLPETFYYSYLSPKIDEASTTNKVRVRSYLDYENVEDNDLAVVAPLYDLPPNESPTDSTKFTIDYSITNALDEDIVSMFGTYKPLDNILGNPELLFSPDYPELEDLRDIYYNRLTDKVNIKGFFDFYKWFDTNISTFIAQLLPRKAKFMGTNFVIENSLIDRSKVEYQSYEQYLGATDRGAIKDSILLSFFEGTSKRY